MKNNDVLAVEIQNLKEKSKDFEKDIETLKSRVNDIDKRFDVKIEVIIEQLKNISNSIKNLTKTSNEAIQKNNESLSSEISNMKIKISQLDKKIEEETIIKSSQKWEKAKWIIVSTVLTGIITFFITKLIN